MAIFGQAIGNVLETTAGAMDGAANIIEGKSSPVPPASQSKSASSTPEPAPVPSSLDSGTSAKQTAEPPKDLTMAMNSTGGDSQGAGAAPKGTSSCKL